MNAETVVAILDALDRASIEAWVDGGWGVDALLGRRTRAHDDLDLVVGLDRVASIVQVLGSRGFRLAEDRLPVRFVLAHEQLGHVDFHTVTFDADGGGLQPQPGGGTFRYPPEGFVSGRIEGRPVPCISGPVQMLCHLGYEPKQKDVDDLLALHRELGVELPSSYRRFL